MAQKVILLIWEEWQTTLRKTKPHKLNSPANLNDITTTIEDLFLQVGLDWEIHKYYEIAANHKKKSTFYKCMVISTQPFHFGKLHKGIYRTGFLVFHL